MRLSLPAVHRTDGAADERSFRTDHGNFPVLHARQMRESGHGRHTDNDVADLGRIMQRYSVYIPLGKDQT